MVGPGDDRLLELGSPLEPPPRARRTVAAVVVAATALVIGALAAIVLPSSTAEDVAVEQVTSTTATATSVTTPDRPDPASFPAPIALGGPTDGKESIGLPIKAEPGTGLVDGQEVTVTGTGFPPGQSIGVVMCTREAGRDHGARGASACNIGRFAQTTSDADGVAVATFSVRRLVVLDGQEVDCASEPGRCLIGMGMISDYDTSGGVLVDFDPSVPLPDPPEVTVEPSGPLADGDEVAVTVTGMVPGTAVAAAVCDASQVACHEHTSGGDTVGSDGTATLRFRVWRAFGALHWEPGPANIDCAVDRCQLAVWGEVAGSRAIPQLPLEFAGGPLGREPLEARLTSEGPYEPGDDIEVLLPTLPDRAGVELVLCGEQGCTGWETRTEPDGDGVRARTEVFDVDHGNPCGGGPCELRVNVYVPPTSGEPPVLLPEAIPVDVRA